MDDNDKAMVGGLLLLAITYVALSLLSILDMDDTKQQTPVTNPTVTEVTP